MHAIPIESEWLKLRQNGIGGSDAGIIMQAVPHGWGTPYTLWKAKLGIGEPKAPNSAMLRGKALESDALNAFVAQHDINMRSGMIWSNVHNFLFATLDGISDCGKYILEIKCPGAADHADALRGKVPGKYKAQIQHYLMVTGAEMCFYWSWDGKEGALVRVARDEVYQADLLEQEITFWQCVQSFTAPALTSGDYQERNDPKWDAAEQEYDVSQIELKSAEARASKAKQALIDLCGGSNTRGTNFRVCRVVRRGGIDYTKIPEIQGIDLEPYRAQPLEYWKLTKEKGE